MYKFMIPIGIALLIAIPVAARGFSKWINTYLYHINVGAYYFIVPALILPLLAASMIAVQVARVNRQKMIISLHW